MGPRSSSPTALKAIGWRGNWPPQGRRSPRLSISVRIRRQTLPVFQAIQVLKCSPVKHCWRPTATDMSHRSSLAILPANRKRQSPAAGSSKPLGSHRRTPCYTRTGANCNTTRCAIWPWSKPTPARPMRQGRSTENTSPKRRQSKAAALVLQPPRRFEIKMQPSQPGATKCRPSSRHCLFTLPLRHTTFRDRAPRRSSSAFAKTSPRKTCAMPLPKAIRTSRRSSGIRPSAWGPAREKCASRRQSPSARERTSKRWPRQASRRPGLPRYRYLWACWPAALCTSLWYAAPLCTTGT